MRSWAYRPRLADGKAVPLSPLLNLLRLTNHVYWPLEDGLSRGWRYADRIALILGFLIFQFHNEAEIRYLWENFNNIDALLTGVPTYIVLIEGMLRGMYVGLEKERLKQLLKKFYAVIYVDQNAEPAAYKHIHWKMGPTRAYSILYLSTLTTFTAIPMYFVFQQRRETLYKMAFAYDYTPYYIFIPIVLSNLYVGVIVATLLYGDGYLISELVVHANERYLLLRRDLQQETAALLQRSMSSQSDNIAVDFQHLLIKVVSRNRELHEFAAEMQQEFSRHIFIAFSVSASLVCAMGFKAYTNLSDSYGYLIWLAGKVLELLAFGEIGTTIIFTTNELSEMYYSCGWEQIIARSSNTLENVRLMKLLASAMAMHQRPFALSGFNFFHVSLEAVLTVKILQAAGSYFTCLIALR